MKLVLLLSSDCLLDSHHLWGHRVVIVAIMELWRIVQVHIQDVIAICPKEGLALLLDLKCSLCVTAFLI